MARIGTRFCRTASPRSLGFVVAGALLACSGSSHGQADHLECYRTKDPVQKQRFTADLNGLVPEPGCEIKVPAELLCVPTATVNVSPPPTGATPGREPGRVLCYKVDCERRDLPGVEITDPFGTRTVEPSRTKLLCAPEAAVTTTTVTTSTTTTTKPGFRATCCETALGCADAVAAAATLCDAVGGALVDDQICDGATGNCAAQPSGGTSSCCAFGSGLCVDGPLVGDACASDLGGTLTEGEDCTFSVGLDGAPVAGCAPPR